MKTRYLLPLLTFAAALHFTPGVKAQTEPAKPDEAQKEAPAPQEGDKEWAAIVEKLQVRNAPPEGASEEEINQWQAKESERLFKIAEEVRSFYTGFPKHPSAEGGRGIEVNVLMVAGRLGGEDASAKVKELIEVRSKEEGLSEEDRFNYRALRTLREAETPEQFEAAVRELAKEFPNNPNIPQLLLVAAQQAEADRARPLIEEVIKSEQAAPALKEQAKKMLESLDIVGKPLDLKFKALDGSDFDIANLKGKVVLIDFWATWCGPCIREIPKIKETYAKFKDKGFEIVGISLDNSKEELEAFIKKENMTWPQYFDGKGFDTELARKYNITGIPTLWLVDKKGILRELNARSDMEQKIEALMAEK